MATAQKKSEPSHYGHRQRLRERYLKNGISSFADYEVIEMLLSLFIPRIDVKPIAKDLICNFKNLRGILDASVEDLAKTKGLDENTCVSIKLIKDLISIYHANELQSSSNTMSTLTKLTNYFKSKIASEKNEVLEMLCLDSQLKIIGDGSIRIAEGSVNSANVDIRKIVEIAIRQGASSIAIAHNHPSGNPKPSLEDILFTKKLTAACKPISISLIEHTIVAKSTTFSFRKDGHFDCLYDEAYDNRKVNSRGVAENLERLI